MSEVPQIEPVFRTSTLPVSGSLHQRVKALVGVEIIGSGPIDLQIAPHDAWMLTVQFARDGDARERKSPHGLNTALTGVRHWTGRFRGAGNCTTLFALLTPLGVVELLDSQRLDKVPRIRAQVGEVLDQRLTKGLEDSIALARSLEDQLHTLGHWLEERAVRRTEHSRCAARAARVAMRVSREPMRAVEDLAHAERVSRRQLERDFSRWLATTPRHWAQVSRVQDVARRARSGVRMADLAMELGFADQPHMCNVIKQLTGLSPKQFMQAGNHPLGVAFRSVTDGGRVYL
jgi:AraC-like DNA-binding protein